MQVLKIKMVINCLLIRIERWLFKKVLDQPMEKESQLKVVVTQVKNCLSMHLIKIFWNDPLFLKGILIIQLEWVSNNLRLFEGESVQLMMMEIIPKKKIKRNLMKTKNQPIMSIINKRTWNVWKLWKLKKHKNNRLLRLKERRPNEGKRNWKIWY
jgi:hypothetical protein